MELILISLLTIMAMCLGIAFGIWVGKKIGYIDGYEDGYEELATNTNTENDFPKTLDGKFFSTEMAIRSMSKSGDDQ